MTTHTEGRLTVRDEPQQMAALVSAIGRIIAECGFSRDARRLAAACNATLGVPLDELERLDVARLVRLLAEMPAPSVSGSYAEFLPRYTDWQREVRAVGDSPVGI